MQLCARSILPRVEQHGSEEIILIDVLHHPAVRSRNRGSLQGQHQRMECRTLRSKGGVPSLSLALACRSCRESICADSESTRGVMSAQPAGSMSAILPTVIQLSVTSTSPFRQPPMALDPLVHARLCALVWPRLAGAALARVQAPWCQGFEFYIEEPDMCFFVQHYNGMTPCS
jgi:hypothetical protein